MVFAKLYAASKRVKFHIKTTEGQHYRRYVLQQKARDSNARSEQDLISSAPKGVNDGKGFVFLSHTGEVYPSRFLPLAAGNVLWEPLSQIYQDAALFRSLRDSSQLKGKCGRCDFKDVCGGSRGPTLSVTILLQKSLVVRTCRDQRRQSGCGTSGPSFRVLI